MTTVETIVAIWLFVAVCSVLFIRGATSMPSSREARRAEALEEV
jgi:hypothetical protein